MEIAEGSGRKISPSLAKETDRQSQTELNGESEGPETVTSHQLPPKTDTPCQVPKLMCSRGEKSKSKPAGLTYRLRPTGCRSGWWFPGRRGRRKGWEGKEKEITAVQPKGYLQN